MEPEDQDLGLDEKVGGDMTFKSMDGLSLVISRTNASLSELIQTTLESDPTAEEASLQVSGAILQRVVDYLNHHQGVAPAEIEKPLTSAKMEDVCSDRWDAEFINSFGPERQKLYDIVKAANYLGIKPLLLLGTSKVASLIKGVPVKDIKKVLDPLCVDPPVKVETEDKVKVEPSVKVETESKM